MPEIIETTIYQFHELSEPAKERARSWYRETALDPDWYEVVYADFEIVCEILGLALKTGAVRLVAGGTRQTPCLYFQGFGSQGDGACFEGVYAYARKAPAKIRRHAPQDAGLHRIADILQAVQRRNFYRLRAEIRHRGRYYHEQSMVISVERDSPTGQEMTADAEDIVTEALRDLARWFYRQLEREYAFQTSDEAVDEAITANAYTFTESGYRFG